MIRRPQRSSLIPYTTLFRSRSWRTVGRFKGLSLSVIIRDHFRGIKKYLSREIIEISYLRRSWTGERLKVFSLSVFFRDHFREIKKYLSRELIKISYISRWSR